MPWQRNTLSVYIKRLRDKLEMPGHPLISTVRGMGYRLEVDGHDKKQGIISAYRPQHGSDFGFRAALWLFGWPLGSTDRERVRSSHHTALDEHNMEPV